MAHVAFEALYGFLSWNLALYLAAGVMLGLVFGILPGVGGTVALAILLPLTYQMETHPALVLLIATHSAVMFGGAISAILINTPGTSQNVATCFDGFPLARQGRAGEALGAAGTASALGGIFGVVILVLVIPVMRSLVLAFGSPEYFMLCIAGLTVIAGMSRGSMVKGLISGGLGVLLSLVGWDQATGQLRFTGGLLYLYDGIDFVPVVIGLFALSEAMQLLIRGGAISSATHSSGRGVMKGIGEAFRNISLVLRCSAVGTVIGMIPGVGGTVANLVAYAHGLQSSRHPEKWGNGAIEGVIAPQSAINAKDGGALVPTLGFGIPGCESTTILLGAFIVHGLTPGPAMLGEHVDVVFVMIWTIVIANLLATAVGLAGARPLVRLTHLPGTVLAPFIFVLCLLGAFASRGVFVDIVLAAVAGLAGLAMKRFGYSRAALVIGLILGKTAEANFHTSYQAYGWSFWLRPISVSLLVVTVAGLILVLRRTRR